MWRIKPLITKLGGAAEVSRRLHRLYPEDAPSAASIRNWCARNTVPSDQLGKLIVLGKLKWANFDVTEFLDMP